MATGKINGGALPVNEGGTGASVAATARANLGIPEPFNVTALYTGSVSTPVANNTEFTLTDDINNYKLLVLQAFAGTPSAGTRMLIIDMPILTSAHGIVGATGGGTMGSVYTEHTTGKSWTFVTSSFSSFYLATIYGIK